MNSYMTKEELRDSGERLFPIKELGSKEDVATLLDTYMDVVENADPARIVEVKEDIDHIYVFILGDRANNKFDLLRFINTKYVGSKTVTNANLRLLFPAQFSRGVGGSRMGNITRASNPGAAVPSLVYKNGNKRIRLTSTVIIGRSKTKANFPISGNADVSRVQCEIGYDENNILRIIDKNSKNGTRVNNQLIPREKDRGGSKGVPLKPGDVISFAGEFFKVQW